MTSKDLVKQALAKWGFPILSESNATIVIRYQMTYMHITSFDEDSKCMSVVLTNLFAADDDRKERLALKTCNELNLRMMQVKFYLDHDNDLIISSEFFYHDEDDVEHLLSMALNAVASGKVRFRRQYSEVEADDQLLQQIDDGLEELE